MSHRDRMLRYCCIVTEEKHLVDLQPLLYNLEIPEPILAAQQKAIAHISKRPATNHNLYEYLRGHPEIQCLSEFNAHLEAQLLAAAGQHPLATLPFQRPKMFAPPLQIAEEE